MSNVEDMTVVDLANVAMGSWLWKLNDDTYGWIGWDANQGANQPLIFEDQHDELWVELDNFWPRFTGTQWHVTFPYDGPSIRFRYDGNVTSQEIYWSSGGVEVTTGFNGGFRTDIMNGLYEYVRVFRNRIPDGAYGDDYIVDNDSLFVEVSTDGNHWEVFETSGGIPFGDFRDNASQTPGANVPGFGEGHLSLYVEVGGFTHIENIHGISVPEYHVDGDDGGVHTEDPDNDIPDTYIPYVPPDADAASKTCTSLLDLIRQFSTDVRRSVRIINGNTIEMVPTRETIPAGFRNGYAPKYYVEDEQDLSANTTVLAANRGKLDLRGRAKFETDNDLILTTDWRMPQRLPFLELGNAPVMRVSYTMTPKHFNCEVEFAFPQVPTGVKR